MEDLLEIFKKISVFEKETERTNNERLNQLRDLLYDTTATAPSVVNHLIDSRIDSPKQTKKRVKRLDSLPEDEAESSTRISETTKINDTKCPELTGKQINETIKTPLVEKIVEKVKTPELVEANLMPPPPAPAQSEDSRPQRAAKLKSEKNLKEPRLNVKMRRPAEEPVIKLEHEQRKSQMEVNVSVFSKTSTSKIISTLSAEDSVTIIPEKSPSIISISSDMTELAESVTTEIQNKEKETEPSLDTHRQPRVRIKREKISMEKVNEQIVTTTEVTQSEALLPETNSTNSMIAVDESTAASVSLSTTSVGQKKKGKKKKQELPMPIKIERFSMLDAISSPIASRLRKGSVEKKKDMVNAETNIEKAKQSTASIYEDAIGAVETAKNLSGIPTNATITNETVNLGSGPANATISNETVNLGSVPANATVVLGAAATDATFITNAAQTTFQVAPGQTTFVIDNNKSSNGGERSFETARDNSTPQNNLLTDDESFEQRQEQKLPVPAKVVPPKNNKIPIRTHELFNPLVQSPVKMKVKAFENAANDMTKSTRPKRTKENTAPTPTSTTTPLIGKLTAPTLGRFLTPTQTNITLAAQNKKTTSSASKAQVFPKNATALSLKKSNSNLSTKTLSRENSAEDFRKGLHQLAEDRKKQREQKHLLAAQLRENKERERVERMAKLAKEREERRIKKQQEAAEQKKRDLEEIQRKQRHEEETAAAIAASEAAKLKTAKAKAIMDQERQMLTQIKQQKTPTVQKKIIMPPPPLHSKYTFEMLHEDDSTDDEGKTSYKRPPIPSWSRSNVRGNAIVMQQYCPTDVIDSFFSVQPMTPDLKLIFPNIDARHLKRNSSAVWSTPPRYSELPKF